MRSLVSPRRTCGPGQRPAEWEQWPSTVKNSIVRQREPGQWYLLFKGVATYNGYGDPSTPAEPVGSCRQGDRSVRQVARGFYLTRPAGRTGWPPPAVLASALGSWASDPEHVYQDERIENGKHASDDQQRCAPMALARALDQKRDRHEGRQACKESGVGSVDAEAFLTRRVTHSRESGTTVSRRTRYPDSFLSGMLGQRQDQHRAWETGHCVVRDSPQDRAGLCCFGLVAGTPRELPSALVQAGS